MEILNVIQSWLSDRTARVAVGGKLSKDMNIHNMVYQGTVLGPPLWNIVYGDAAVAVNFLEFLETFRCNRKCDYARERYTSGERRTK